MVKKLSAAIIILSLVLLAFGAAYAEETNLVLNPGFEESSSEYTFWEQRIWDTSSGAGEISIQTGQAHSGNNCIRISNGKENDSRLVQVVSVEPSTLYKISGWIKTENVGAAAKGANLSVWMMMLSTKDVKDTSDWTYVELFGRTGPDQTTLEFTIGLGGHGSLNTGTAYFDDISIEETISIPEGAGIENLYNSQTNNTETDTSGSKGNSWLIVLIALIAVAIGVILFFVFRKSEAVFDNKDKTEDGQEIVNSKGDSESNSEVSSSSLSRPKLFKIDAKDLIIMGIMTLVYTVIALINLGSTNVPESFWKPSKIGSSFTVNFPQEYDLSKIAYYNGIGDLNIRVEYQREDGEFVPVSTINQDVYKALMWASIDTQLKTKTLKFTVHKIGGTLNEIVFFKKGSNEPIKDFSINAQAASNKNDMGKVENLFDENDVGEYKNNYMNSTYFDEIYFPRTAFEHIYRMEPYETTHPPLGKIFIAIGMLIFGVNPFGWRIMGTLFGAAMVPVMYLFGKKIFHKRIYGFISAFLIMFEFMHFAQTRIATIDSYAGLFVILAYYFMYDTFINKSYKMGFKQSLLPLLFAGIFWGLGSASKWTAVYAGGGLAVLYFTAKMLEYMDYKKAISPKVKKSKLPAWTHVFISNNIVLTSLACVIFFVVIPIIIYTASYLPIITLPGEHHNLGEVWRYQVNMFDYHAKLTDPHPFESPAHSWPLITKPLLEYRDTSLPADRVSLMYILGNPAVFWVGIICVFAALLISIMKKDKRIIPVLVAFAFQYLPWFRVTRCIFIYHFFTAVPFMILCIVYVLNFLREDFPRIVGRDFGSKSAQISTYNISTVFIFSYLLITAVLFIWFYPAISGMEVPSDYLYWVKWLHVL